MEKLMQYVWQYRLWHPYGLQTVDGKHVEVIDQGQLNTGAGPDFFNAKAKLDGQLWAGNIEIHVRASDWYRHGHDHDPAYNNVILHVVQTDDMAVRRPDGMVLPQIVMPCAHDFANRYHQLVNNPTSQLRCGAEIAAVPQIYITDWLTAMGYERLYEKVDRALAYLARAQGDWQTVVYVTLARALGFSINAEPMERLAWHVPLRILGKHSDDLTAIEAMLFGTAGMLQDIRPDDTLLEAYLTRLRQEWEHYSTKFGLAPTRDLMWKMGRIRPTNFPHRRIATLAAMVEGGFGLAYQLLNATDEETMRQLFRMDMQGWWTRHYTFNATATGVTPTALSESSIAILLINVAAPLIYAYGLQNGLTERQDFALDLLHRLKPESNSIVALFVAAGIKCPDAFTSQAMIQCRRNYCDQRKCLFCRLGHRLLASKTRP